MKKNQKFSEAAALDQYRTALRNAELQPKIATAMAELGYDSTVIAAGKPSLSKPATPINSIKPKMTKHRMPMRSLIK